MPSGFILRLVPSDFLIDSTNSFLICRRTFISDLYRRERGLRTSLRAKIISTMNKQNYLYGIIGLLAGLMIGYVGTDHINRNAPSAISPTESGDEASLPSNHPPTDGTSNTASDS